MSDKIDIDKLDEDTKKELKDAEAIKDMVDNCTGWQVFIEYLQDKKNSLEKSWVSCKTIEQLDVLKESLKFVDDIWSWITAKLNYNLKSKDVLDKNHKT